MAYLKPPWYVTKLFNPLAMAAGISGSETLTLTRRSTGEVQRIPVLTVTVDGTRYLVSTRGESQWVKNVRATPEVTVSTRAGSTRYRAAEVPVDARADVLAAYQIKAGKVVDGYFAQLPDAADHPVFALNPL